MSRRRPDGRAPPPQPLLFRPRQNDTIPQGNFARAGYRGVRLARSNRSIVAGIHRVPGDKSITHRALLLAALARGTSTLHGALTSADARSTAHVLRQLGAAISPLRAGQPVTVRGHRRFATPTGRLDCGNSGTTARLLLGLLAAHRFSAVVTGDASLRRRPMRRVTEPLVVMGARVTAAPHDGLPLTIRGGGLHPLDWRLPVASAQIKSALLLAGAIAGVPVSLHEPAASRDHTERMLRHFGFDVESPRGGIRMKPTGRITPFEIRIPGDPSSAIFLLAAAALAERGSIAIEGVGLNPSRIGYLTVLDRMGIAVAMSPAGVAFGERHGTLLAAASALRAVTVDAIEVPGLIDEIPMLACLAARAPGTSRFAGLAELRVKESDRLALLGLNLRNVGVAASVDGDDLIVTGSPSPLRGRVVTHGDHRIAMAFAVLGTQPGARIGIDDPACTAVSFPGFANTLAALFPEAA
ncbi:MAG: 3-phosphoshikimate 1-carboxyvinyltransferase [Gemmatimonadales bacterium]